MPARSAGLDTNLVHIADLAMCKTATGFGMNLESGIEVAATPALALGVGFDYHPGDRHDHRRRAAEHRVLLADRRRDDATVA